MDLNHQCSHPLHFVHVHASCPGTVWNGVDLMLCVCPCHPRVRNGCAQGAHDLCETFIAPYMLCDCLCHFFEVRSKYVGLRSRVASR